MQKLIISLPIAVCMGSTSWAVCQTNFGNVQCEHGEVASCHGSGVVHINGTHIKGDCRVFGDIHINDATISQLFSKGQLNIRSSRIDMIKHDGQLELISSHVNQLTIRSNLVRVNASNVDNLIVSSFEEAHVYVTNESNVKSIRFTGVEGYVHTTSKGQVHTVSGGKIVVK